MNNKQKQLNKKIENERTQGQCPWSLMVDNKDNVFRLSESLNFFYFPENPKGIFSKMLKKSYFCAKNMSIYIVYMANLSFLGTIFLSKLPITSLDILHHLFLRLRTS